MRLFFLVFAFAFFVACKKKSASINPVNVEKTLSEVVTETENENPSFTKFLQKFQLKPVPAIDSTSFDNFEKLEKFTADDLKELKPNKIFPDGSDFRINSKYELSPEFKTISITFNKGEMELSTELLNFNKKGELIDHVEISYDEIAESAFRKWSEISNNNMTITEENYLEEPAKIEKHQFRILSTGKIKK